MAGSAAKENDSCIDKLNLDDQRSFAFLVENRSGSEHGEKQDIKSNKKKHKLPYSSISNENINKIDDYQHNCDYFEVPNEKPLFLQQEGVTQKYNVNEDFESVNSFFENEFKSDSQNHPQSRPPSDSLHISTDIISKLTEKAQVVNAEENDNFLNKSKINKNESKRKVQKSISKAKENKKIKTKQKSETRLVSNNSLVLSKYIRKPQQYSFPCSLCFRHFVHPYDCLVHMITKACIKVSSHLYRTGKGLTCKTCGKTNFKSSKQAEKHAHRHEKDKFKACPVCSQQFSPISVLHMIKHVQENHKEYLNTLNIRKWVRHHNIENNAVKCEIPNTVLQVNEQLASIAKPKEAPKILQNLLWGKRKSCNNRKFENIQNQLEDNISESSVSIIKDRPSTGLANSDLDSLPESSCKFKHISPELLLSTSVNTSECITKYESKTERTASNLKDIPLSEEYNENICEEKFIYKFNLENRTKDETVIIDDQERKKESTDEISNSHDEDEDLFFGTCFCESKCKIHKDLNTNKLENCEISDEVLEDLFSCPDCIHTCGMDEEYNISTSITSTSSSSSGHRKKNKQCPYCDKKYESNYKLKIHLYTHSGERPFVCDICGHGFARRPNLMAHYRVHTGAKEYPCTKCDRTFGHPSDRIAHLINRVCDRAIHVKETEDGWQCITCGKAEFKSYNQAERHGRTHESAHIKKCPVCQEEFRGRKLHPLVKHVRSCHPDYLRELGL